MAKLGELKVYATQLIDEYSGTANITDAEDIRAKLNNLFNMAQIELCQKCKIKKQKSIIQNIPPNTITPSDNPDSIYTHNSEDLVFSGKGKSYHFQVKGTATITISQSGMVDRVIENTDNNVFTTYKGTTSGSGVVTITFSGNYYYSVKNVAVFDANFNQSSDIPNYERYIEYDLPSDYYHLDNVELKGVEYKDYDIKGKKIRINAYDIGEYVINYFAYPTTITSETEDTFEFELEPVAQMILPWSVASDILKSDVSANYTSFEAKYNAKLEILNNAIEKPTIKVVDLFGCGL